MVTNFWGKAGAGILFFCDSNVLLIKRSGMVTQPYTWATPGGSVEGEYYVDPESPVTVFPSVDQFWVGAKREVKEELGNLPRNFTVFDIVEFQHKNFKFMTFLASLMPEVRDGWEIELNWESSEFKWFPTKNLPKPLHFGIQHILKEKPDLF